MNYVTVYLIAGKFGEKKYFDSFLNWKLEKGSIVSCQIKLKSLCQTKDPRQPSPEQSSKGKVSGTTETPVVNSNDPPRVLLWKVFS